jgi:hypothetical protein
MSELRFHRAANWNRLAAEIAAIPGALRPSDPLNPFAPLSRYSLVQDTNAGDIVINVDEDAPAGLGASITAVVAVHDATPDPIIPVPDYGNDATPDQTQLVQAVATLRQYLAIASPTAPQTTAAFKLLIRVVLFILKRTIGG